MKLWSPASQLSRQTLTVLTITTLFLASIASIILLRYVLLLFFVAFIIASALHPIVTSIHKRHRVPPAVTSFLLVLAIISIVILFFTWVIPPLANQSIQLLASLQALVPLPNVNLNSFSTEDFSTLSRVFQDTETFFNQFGQSWRVLISVVNSFFQSVFIFFTILFLVYYMLISFDDFSSLYAWLLPGSKQQKTSRAKEILEKVRLQLGTWVRARAFVMVLIGTASYIFLALMNVPYALPLAIMAGIFELVPNIGPTLSWIPALIITLVYQGIAPAVVVSLFYGGMQQLEGYVITPQVMKKTVDVSPVTSMFLLFVGFEFMGVAGSFLSLPLYVAIRAVVRELWPEQNPFSNGSSE